MRKEAARNPGEGHAKMGASHSPTTQMARKLPEQRGMTET